ncbi:MAG TPA: ABC transporter substrate-binding protein [Thermoanaerobaculia bacterium]|nr:ABC transporter substrate-binding protein [Thermoanaerobaculia bacterium]
MAVALLALAGLLAAPALSGAPEADTDSAAFLELGRRVYVDGVGAEGREIVAVLAGGAEVSAAVLPCAGCHGAGGRGRPEGGVSPSNLTWEALTKPYGVTHGSGRAHPPYDERSLVWAVTHGVDPGGNALSDAMPRYRLSRREAEALVAYLRQLGSAAEPGVTGAAVRLGVVLPPPELGGLAEALRAVLEAVAERANEAGGFYGRRVELRFAQPAGTPAGRRAAVAELLDEDRPFALVAGFIAGADGEITALAAERRVPMVGPFTLHPQVGLPLNRWVFYLISGLDQQARALVDFAARRAAGAPPARVVAIHPEEPVAEGVAAAIRAQGRRHGAEGAWGAVAAVPFAPGGLDARSLVDRELAAGTGVAFLLGSEAEVWAVLAAAAEAGWAPAFYVPGALLGGLGNGLPLEAARRVVLSSPVLDSDRRPGALARFRALDLPDGGPAAYRPMQLAAMASAEVLFEGLERAGRDLTREGLVEALEGLYDYDTGLVPPVTYGPSRRIGALGAHILAFDEGRGAFRPTGEWVTPR